MILYELNKTIFISWF